MDDHQALTFLDQLYGTFEDDGWLTLFSVDRHGGEPARPVDWATMDDRDILAEQAHDRAKSCCVWLGVASRKERLEDGKRGGRGDCAHLPGLWVDIDVAGPNHKGNQNLPPTLDHAHLLLKDFQLAPTAVINSGGGLQAWWLFAEPVAVEAAVELLERWTHTWQELGRRRDWHVDNVFDVARVMRLPGTMNRKTDPAPVEITEADWQRRYGLDDLEEATFDPPARQTAAGGDREPYSGPERAGAAYSRLHTGSEILEGVGFTLERTDRNGDEHWTRPGKDTRDGPSATVYAEDGHSTIWSDTCTVEWPAIQVRKPYDPFGLYVRLHHAGDFTAAAKVLAKEGYGEPLLNPEDWITPSVVVAEPPEADQQSEDPSSWTPVDLAAMRDGNHVVQKPEVFERTDGQCLLYLGKCHSFSGEPESGKSWAALLATLETIRAGQNAIYIDFEDNEVTLTQRLLALSATWDQIAGHLTYLRPQEPLIDRHGQPAKGQLVLDHLLEQRPYHLAVIDGVTESMSLHGWDPLQNHDYARWHHLLPRRLARHGAATVQIDHVTKSKEQRGRWPIGAQHKLAAIDGATFSFEAVTPFGIGRKGMAKIGVEKDRPGQLRQHAAGKQLAELHIDSTAHRNAETSEVGVIVADLRPPESENGGWRPTVYMERVANYLTGRQAPVNQTTVVESVKGDEKYTRQAILALVAEGFVECMTVKGGYKKLRLLKPLGAVESWLETTAERE